MLCTVEKSLRVAQVVAPTRLGNLKEPLPTIGLPPSQSTRRVPVQHETVVLGMATIQGCGMRPLCFSLYSTVVEYQE